MPAYVDSSLVLAMLLREPTGEAAMELWGSHPQRVASRLLVAECVTAIRRASRGLTAEAAGSWMGPVRGALARLIEEIDLVDVSSDVVSTLAREEALGACRSLDALHLATALLIRPAAAPEDLVVLTLDREMARVARALGLTSLPADL